MRKILLAQSQLIRFYKLHRFERVMYKKLDSQFFVKTDHQKKSDWL